MCHDNIHPLVPWLHAIKIIHIHIIYLQEGIDNAVVLHLQFTQVLFYPA